MKSPKNLEDNPYELKSVGSGSADPVVKFENSLSFGHSERFAQSGHMASSLGLRTPQDRALKVADVSSDDTPTPEGVKAAVNPKKKQTFMEKLSTVLRESIISFAMIGIIIGVVIVQFTIIDRISAATVEYQSTLIAADATAQVGIWLREKTAVVDHHEYLYRTGQFNARSMVGHPRYAEVNQSTLEPNPVELQQYEVMTTPFFANDVDLLALYNAFSNNQTWKISAESPPNLNTQLRFVGTVSATNSTPYYERYERQRGRTDQLENFVLGKHQIKRYLPTEQGWYQAASNVALFNATTNLYSGVWDGPKFQGTGAGANDNYGLEPVMEYLRKVLWHDTTKFSVFKLKILTSKVNAMLRNLNIPGSGDIAIVNAAGDLAGYRQPAQQVIPDPADPTNAKTATFTKLWSVSHFSAVTQADLGRQVAAGTRLDLGNGVSLFPVDEEKLPGFRMVIYLNGEELIAPYTPLFNTILGLAILLIVLGFIAIVYSTHSVQRHMSEASNAMLGRLLGDLLPGQIANKVVDRVQWPITDTYPACTVFFSDIVNFTNRSQRAKDPVDIVVMLNRLVEEFDHLSTFYKVEKIKTIGDCYMAVSGAPEASPSHASDMMRFAFAVLEIVQHYNQNENANGEPVHFRIGINSGAVIGAVIGARRFLFDVFGPTVNIASRVEGASLPMSIRCTLATKQCIESESSSGDGGVQPQEHEEFLFLDEADITVKGVSDKLRVYFVHAKNWQ